MRSNITPRLRTIFFGTSSFATPSLDALVAAHDVLLVVTQPDRPAGRGLELKPSGVKRCAAETSQNVVTPQRLDERFIADVAKLRPQLLAVASYGKILPSALLDIPGMAALNVHPSLLPEYRGATPIQTALREGRTSTGVSIIWMSAQMDAGDIALARETLIGPDEDFGRLHDRLADLGAEMLVEAAELLANSALPRVAQDHARATYTKPLTKDDFRIRSDATAKQSVDLVRSASPRPGAWTTYAGKRLKVLEARAEPPGSPLTTAEGPALAVSDGIVRLLRVVPEGRREMSGAQFARSSS